ncbi:hypothetical protein TPA0910_39120 [Streptomyces hygroscopicus subsp. sporocinereus]|uniref:Transposase n=1 Tax=Streptomyces hygroscopicus TaxID=1912 RepID=A0ABQ3U1J4_STRHY|nr:hypothetical protein TPA0910_39120 [Streptomyces hygroscopicus]
MTPHTPPELVRENRFKDVNDLYGHHDYAYLHSGERGIVGRYGGQRYTSWPTVRCAFRSPATCRPLPTLPAHLFCRPSRPSGFTPTSPRYSADARARTMNGLRQWLPAWIPPRRKREAIAVRALLVLANTEIHR